MAGRGIKKNEISPEHWAEKVREMLIDAGSNLNRWLEPPLCHPERATVLVPSQKSRVTEEATIRTGRKNYLTLDSPQCSLFAAQAYDLFRVNRIVPFDQERPRLADSRQIPAALVETVAFLR